ncbi:MAG: CBS domain-containing protein [Halobacteriovoraceae bacterium]|jgi:CBS domain-containing protein|nr:CBS domain-containing protein [Halobacteriovoraceae bacterium]MBT5094255.1 CBS domain-containing protein [Halobacteriovoraceae bacterium]
MDLQSKVGELEFSRELKTCPSVTKISEVLGVFQSKRIGAMIIVDNNKVVGIFTERDYVNKVAGQVKDITKVTVGEFMTHGPKCVTEDNAIKDVLEMMHTGNFRHVVVIDNTYKLIGIISIKDMLEFLILNISDLETNMSDLVAAMV